MTVDLKPSLCAQTRYRVEDVLILRVQVPQTHAERILDAITQVCDLAYGDYTHVSFEEAAGTQRFAATGAGRNTATGRVVCVPCVQLTAQLPASGHVARDVVTAIYDAHPYEEPVIDLSPAFGTRHVRGMDEDNPNRFWNSDMPDWVPSEHR